MPTGDAPGDPAPARGGAYTYSGVIHWEYSPHLDRDADPGEVVWTWVAFEDDPTVGKDRPVAVVGRTEDHRLVALMLSSRNHDGQSNWMPVGTGSWMPKGATAGYGATGSSRCPRRRCAERGRSFRGRPSTRLCWDCSRRDPLQVQVFALDFGDCSAGVSEGGRVMSNPWDATSYDTQFGFVGRYGDDLLELLAPVRGESILDLGCGTGRHAAEIASRGAHVIGLDADRAMLDKARRDHPDVTFVAGDATSFDLTDLEVVDRFDACFSNAALHWMTPQDAVLRNVRAVLAESGRFVAEMGGAGNIEALDASLRSGLIDVGLAEIAIVSNYFPTLGEQAALLEATGFRVELATWFRRPTPLGAGTTAADWTRHFRAATWAAVPGSDQGRLADLVNEHAAERGLLTEDGWMADYRRLRFVAVAI